MTTTSPARIAAGTYQLDPMHSSAAFKVQHFGLAWLRGSFAELELQATGSEDGAFELVGSTPVASIAFSNEQLHGHLMSPDFFDAQLHPRISFASTRVELDADGTARVAGDLSIKGTTLPVELTGSWAGPVEGLGGDTRIGLELAGEIDRDAFGVSWSATLPTGQAVVAKGVKLEGSFELVLQ